MQQLSFSFILNSGGAKREIRFFLSLQITNNNRLTHFSFIEKNGFFRRRHFQINKQFFFASFQLHK